VTEYPAITSIQLTNQGPLSFSLGNIGSGSDSKQRGRTLRKRTWQENPLSCQKITNDIARAKPKSCRRGGVDRVRLACNGVGSSNTEETRHTFATISRILAAVSVLFLLRPFHTTTFCRSGTWRRVNWSIAKMSGSVYRYSRAAARK